MERMVSIPVAYQIVVDDVGWFNGDDDRCNEGPSRTGMPRLHTAEDYHVLNELGKALDMKINCPLVLGEWDKDNVLRGMKHATNNEAGWNMASQIDMNVAEKCFQAAEDGEYIEYSYHGLMHGYWNDGRHVADQEFYIPADYDYKERYTNNLVPVSKEYFESHLEAFFKIYNSWGFKKKIRSFASPSSVYGSPQMQLEFADVLKSNGIIYWTNMWSEMKDMSCVLNGVIFLKKHRGYSFLPWNAYDIDPALLPNYAPLYRDGAEKPDGTIFPAHWPNFLRFNPMDNFEKVNEWIKYFKRQSEMFGFMLSKDIAFAASQAIYSTYTKVCCADKKVILDFSEVDNKNAIGKTNELYISIQNGLNPVGCVGGSISIYETHPLFKTYKLERNGKKAEILFE